MNGGSDMILLRPDDQPVSGSFQGEYVMDTKQPSDSISGKSVKNPGTTSDDTVPGSLCFK